MADVLQTTWTYTPNYPYTQLGERIGGSCCFEIARGSIGMLDEVSWSLPGTSVFPRGGES